MVGEKEGEGIRWPGFLRWIDDVGGSGRVKKLASVGGNTGWAGLGRGRTESLGPGSGRSGLGFGDGWGGGCLVAQSCVPEAREGRESFC